jgi:hypothetical protein
MAGKIKAKTGAVEKSTAPNKWEEKIAEEKSFSVKNLPKEVIDSLELDPHDVATKMTRPYNDLDYLEDYIVEGIGKYSQARLFGLLVDMGINDEEFFRDYVTCKKNADGDPDECITCGDSMYEGYTSEVKVVTYMKNLLGDTFLSPIFGIEICHKCASSFSWKDLDELLVRQKRFIRVMLDETRYDDWKRRQE